MFFEEMADSELPLKANNIWTLNEIGSNVEDPTQFIILGVEQNIIILKAGDSI